MAIGYTELDFVNGSAPALSAANLNHIDEALKDACDLLDAETTAGRALVEAADAAAQRSALGLGDSATKNVGTGAGDVAAGDAPAGAVTTHESTYAHANLPTAAGKTAADAIGAATGADTGAKIKTLVGDASTSNKGVALLGASGGAAKLTAMPDGAMASYARDDWTSGADSWSAQRSTLSYPTASIIRATWASTGIGFGIYRVAYSAKSHLVRVRANRACTARLLTYDGSSYSSIDFQLSTEWTVISRIARVGDSVFYIYNLNDTAGDWLDVDWVWIGDYSMLDGSMLLESARVANELAVTQGVGVAASGTITATDLATAGKGDTIHGKKYTFVDALTASPGVEGEVLKAATKEEEIENENLAISEVSRANNGVKYWAAAVHPLVSTTRSGAVLNLSAKNPGLSGNQITVTCESGTNHTASGSTLTGGKDAVGEKIRTQVENYIAGSGTRPAAAKVELTNTSYIGYETTVDVASGGTFTLPSGGTWYWNVYGYGATISSAKRGSSAGGTTLTVAGANASVGYRRVA